MTRSHISDFVNSMIGMHTGGGFEDPFFTTFGGPTAYPPYNLTVSKSETGDSTIVLELAVAGFTKDNLSVEIDKDNLVVSGSREVDEKVTYIKQGISGKNFRRMWKMGKGIQVKDVKLEDGLLRIVMADIIPEEEKVKRLEILT